MSRVLLTGATGVLGQELRPRLLDTGHDVRAASRSPPEEDTVEWVTVDLTEGTGIKSALEEVDIVVHAASDARGDSQAVDVDGTNRLLAASEVANVTNFLYVSIVGIDEIPYSYYQHKLEAEQAIEASSVPSTIIRSTQFHPFLAAMLNMLDRWPIWPIPTRFQLQPIAASDAAEAIVEYAEPDAAGRVPDIGGPAVLSGRELAEAYRDVRGRRWPIVRLPLPGKVASAFRSGSATCPDGAVGTVEWDEWLQEQEGVPGEGLY